MSQTVIKTNQIKNANISNKKTATQIMRKYSATPANKKQKYLLNKNSSKCNRKSNFLTFMDKTNLLSALSSYLFAQVLFLTNKIDKIVLI